MPPPGRLRPALAVALLALDTVLIGLHVACRLRWIPDDPMLSLETDGGYAEWFQYAKELFVLLAFATLAVRRRRAVFAALSALFLYLLLDDSLQIHERLGGVVGAAGGLHRHFGLRPQALGELAVTAVAGSILFAAIGLGYLRADGEARRIARWTVGLTLVLVFFGVGLDALNSATGRWADVPGGPALWVRQVIRVLHLAEEGGELVSMTAIVTFVAGLREHAAVRRQGTLAARGIRAEASPSASA